MGQALRNETPSNNNQQPEAANDNRRPKPRLVTNNVSTKDRSTRAPEEEVRGNAIARQRHERKNTKGLLNTKPRTRNLSTDQRREANIRKARVFLPYRNALRAAAAEETNVTGVRRTKAFTRGVITLGSVLYPMIIQTMFALLSLFALAAEDSWWGWVDIIDASMAVASISWVIALSMGTYTMFIASFMLGKYFKHWKVVLAFMFCFSANWVPGIQLVPWVAIWILFIILHEK